MMPNTPQDRLTDAVRSVEMERRASIPVATAEEMLGLVRAHRHPAPARAAARPAPTVSAAARLAWRIGLMQLRIIHRAVLPVVVALVVAGSLALPAMGAPADAAGRLHGAFVLGCVTLASVLATPLDVRREYLAVTPVSPAVVLIARLTALLGTTMAVAAGCSVALSLTGVIAAPPAAAVLFWLGPALLTAGAVTWAGVWRGTGVATVTGILTLIVVIPAAQGQLAWLSPLLSAALGVIFLVFAVRLAGRAVATAENSFHFA